MLVGELDDADADDTAVAVADDTADDTADAAAVLVDKLAEGDDRAVAEAVDRKG